MLQSGSNCRGEHRGRRCRLGPATGAALPDTLGSGLAGSLGVKILAQFTSQARRKSSVLPMLEYTLDAQASKDSSARNKCAGAPLRVPQALHRGTAGAVPRLWRSRGESVARDEGPEPQAVTPYLIREAAEAGVVAVRRPDGAMVEGIKDNAARWL